MGWLTRAQAAALSEEERLDFLTRTILGEAVSEGYTGMLIVAQVIHNRSEDGRWPSDPVAVAGQSWQFTTNSPGEGGNQGMVSRNYGPGTPQYKMAQAAVRAAIVEQSVPDITGDAKYYHTTAMGWPSSWPSSIKRNGFIDIGRHRVYPDHPVPPGEIPAKLASLQYVDGEVGTLLSVYDERGIKPVRPATMGAATRLTRELNRVAEQRASAGETIKRSRAFAFGSTIDPFEMGRPSITDLIINRPVPAMKASMQAEIDRRPRATGTPTTTERTFAQLTGGQGLDAPGLTLVSSGQRPLAVQAAPWGVRQEVAAAVAASDAAAGRGQITMTGNPNIAGAVVDWLYPRIEEGQGEANQDGKGNRAVKPAAAAPTTRGAVLHPFDPSINEPRPNEDGSISTEVTRTVQFSDGSWGNVPSLWWKDGGDYRDFGDLNDDELAYLATTYERQSGQQFPRYGTVRQAEREAVKRSDAGAGTTGVITRRPLSASDRIREAQAEQRQFASKPIVVVSNGKATVVTEPKVFAPGVVQQSIENANQASNPALAASLAASIAARPTKKAITPATQQTAADIRRMRDAQNGKPTTPAKPAVTAASQQTAADLALIRNANQNAKPSAAGTTVPSKDTTRLPTGNAGLDYVAPPAQLPAMPPPRSNPIGIMPKFSELGALNKAPATLQPKKAPNPRPVEEREVARGSTLFGQPAGSVAPTVPITQPTAADAVPMPRPRPATTGPTTRTVPTTRVTTTAPVPASVDDMMVARRANVLTPPAGRPGLRIVVDGANPIRKQPAARPAPAQQRTPTSAVKSFTDQGMSSADAYDAANAAAEQRAIQNAAPQYTDPNALWRRMLG